MRLRTHSVLLAGLGLLLAAPAPAGEIRVGSGASLSLGDAAVDAGCNDLHVEGTLEGGSAQVDGVRDLSISGQLDAQASALQVAGDWTQAGSFDADSSAVVLGDGCGVALATVSGDTTFGDFAMLTDTGKAWAIEAGSTQTFTGSFTLEGGAQRLVLESTQPGVAAEFDVQNAGATGDRVEVQDNHLVGESVLLSPGSQLSGNTLGWLLVAAVPALAPFAALLLVGALVAGAHRRMARTP